MSDLKPTPFVDLPDEEIRRLIRERKHAFGFTYFGASDRMLPCDPDGGAGHDGVWLHEGDVMALISHFDDRLTKLEDALKDIRCYGTSIPLGMDEASYYKGALNDCIRIAHAATTGGTEG